MTGKLIWSDSSPVKACGSNSQLLLSLLNLFSLPLNSQIHCSGQSHLYLAWRNALQLISQNDQSCTMPPPGIAHPVSHAQLGTLWSYNTVIPRDHGTTHTLHDSAFVQTPTYLQPVSAEEKPVVAVIGVGYVGLHLLQCFGPKYRVIAFDTSEPRIASLRQVFASYPDVIGTTKSEHLNESTHFLICVPTAVMSDKTIDISALQAAIDTLHRHARPGATVVIESSVFVGATRQLLTPLARLRGILAGMSPEVSFPPSDGAS